MGCRLFGAKPLSKPTRATRPPAFWEYSTPTHDYTYYWFISDPKSKQDKVNVTSLTFFQKFNVGTIYTQHYYHRNLLMLIDEILLRFIFCNLAIFPCVITYKTMFWYRVDFKLLLKFMCPPGIFFQKDEHHFTCQLSFQILIKYFYYNQTASSKVGLG